MYYYGVDAFNLHAYHSQQTFMEAYRKTNAYKYLTAIDRDKPVCQEYIDNLKKLNNKRKRANHIMTYMEDYCKNNKVQYEVVERYYKSLPIQSTNPRVDSRHPRCQMMKLAEKVAAESQAGYRYYLQQEKNALAAKATQNMTTGQVSKLSKEKKIEAAKTEKALKL